MERRLNPGIVLLSSAQRVGEGVYSTKNQYFSLFLALEGIGLVHAIDVSMI